MPSSARRLLTLVPGLVALLAACSEEPPAATPPAPTGAPTADPAATAAPVATAAPDAPRATEEGHRYLVSVASCWFGGLWTLVENQPQEARKEADQARCHDVVKVTWGSDDPAHYEKLRALEPNEVDKLGTKLDGIASSDPVDGPRRDTLAKLLKTFADAQRESLFARRAADKIRRDLDKEKEKEPKKLSDDEVAAVEPLRAHKGLEALFNLAATAGDLGPEAHALAVLTAMDRMSDARGLPKHMKMYAVGDSFGIVFGVTPPEAPSDPSQPLKPGTWLGYLADVAKAAGHPVPATAKTPKQRDPLAWGGVLAGFSDKLKADAPKVAASTDLSKLLPVVAKRLDDEYAAIQSAPPPDAKPAKGKK
jgi:hypothetical protein